MATVESYETSLGRRYRVRYRKPDQTQTSKRGFKTKKEAEIFLATVEVGKASGTYIDPASARITVGQLGDDWLKTQTHLKPSSMNAVESAWRLHVRPAWGRVNVGEVRFSDVSVWLARLSRGVPGKQPPKSATIVLRAHGILLSILESAVRDRRVSANAAQGVPLPRKVPRPHRYLSHEEVHALVGAAGSYGLIVQLLAYTGIRWGELAGLRVRHIDLERSRLSIEENAVLTGGKVIVGTPKTHKRRSVPFPKLLEPALRAQLAGKGEEDLAFSSTLGTYIKTPTAHANSWFDRAIQISGLPEMTIHDLRHTAASLAISAGANVKAVQRMLGHASAAMTLDTYADLFDDDMEDVAVRMNEAATVSIVSTMWPRDGIEPDPGTVDGAAAPENKGK
ncbi:MAG: site-specific integrase [Microbacteriaceae bacterium]|nr:site-specific integrase [Microbacteriaceae bacterium]